MKYYSTILAVLIIIIMPGAHALAAIQPVSYPPVLITELSPGTEISASQEFIELYNQSGRAIDLAAEKWEVQIASAAAKDWSRARHVALAGTFYPGTYLLLASSYVVPGETKSYLEEHASVSFAPGMTAVSGHVRLVRDAIVQDALEWSVVKEGQRVSEPIEDFSELALTEALAEEQSIKRHIGSDGTFTVMGSSSLVVSSCPSPTATNLLSLAAVITEQTILPLKTTLDSQNQQCLAVDEPSETEEPIPQAPTEPPAVLLPSTVPAATQAPSKQKTIPVADKGLLAPQLTELLPNPGSPGSDAEDEFIELYNPNDATYDLSGFMVYAGAATAKKYTFPEGTLLPARSFMAFFSADTHLSLTNSGGQVRLLDPLDREIAATAQYTAARDNQSWSRIQGAWQWTTVPTPHAANVLQVPATAAKTTKSMQKTAASATKSTSAHSTATPTPAAQTAATVVDETPVHPWVLAGVGGLALLYGAYEYRRDVANRIHQFRRNRADRRADRARITGR